MSPLALAILRQRVELIHQLWSTIPGEEESNGEWRQDDWITIVAWEKDTFSTT